MSDILPKFKLYLFICFISFLCNLSVFFYKGIVNVSGIGLIDFAGISIGSFVPFVNLTMFIGINIPIEIYSGMIAILIVLSGIQTFLVAMFVFQIIHNLIWNPDV
jgi:hypothetical protein